jgi:uncharacterized protein YbbC (DUF1343 family)
MTFSFRVIDRPGASAVNMEAELNEFGLEGYTLAAVSGSRYFLVRQG